ncbi:MAG: PorT family protein [Lewinellaceae bacterium]|jgi:hypothetical protein|nr:PorT family protein [Lewinellaceae bacterium]
MTHRIFFTAALLLSLAVCSNAQFSVGISTGANVSFWEWRMEALNLDLDYDPGLGFRTALQAGYQLTPGFGLQLEGAFQRISNRLDVEITDANGSSTGQMHRISTVFNSVGGSLLLKFSPLKKLPGLYLATGPTFVHFTDGWWRIPGGAVEGRPKAWRDHFKLNESPARPDQWLADFGLGYAHGFGGKNRLAVDLRFQHGLNNFSDVEGINARVQNLLLSVGFQRNL